MWRDDQMDTAVFATLRTGMTDKRKGFKMSDAEIFITSTGPLATRVVPTVDDVEPEFIGFVRSWVLWLDPGFPQTGRRGSYSKGGIRNESLKDGGWEDGLRVRGSWIDDHKVKTEFVQAEEITPDDRGLRILRLYRITPQLPHGPYEGAIRVYTLGAANGARLELRWNFIASENEVRGISAQLTVEGAGHSGCVADFRRLFDISSQ
jgi:hypothetical protein